MRTTAPNRDPGTAARSIRLTAAFRNAYAAPGDPYFWGAVGFASNGSAWLASAPVTVGRVVAPIAPSRNSAGNQPLGDVSHCGSGGYALCWTWAGTAHLEFERLPVDLTLTRSPGTEVSPGTSVTFTAGMNPASVPSDPSHPIVMAELKWRWIPLDASSADTLSCASTSGATCTKVVTTPGVMYASAYVNGKAQQQESRVSLVPGPAPMNKLMLTATPRHVSSGGGAVTFTAYPQTATEDWGVTGWLYIPDSGAVYSTANCPRQSSLKSCTDSVTRTGTMRVYGYVPTIAIDSADYRVYVGADGLLKVRGPTTFDPDAGPITFTAFASAATSVMVESWAFHPSGVLANRIPSSTPKLAPSGPTSQNVGASKKPSPSHERLRTRERRIDAGVLYPEARSPRSALTPTRRLSLGDTTGGNCSQVGVCTFLPSGAGYVIVTGSVDGETQTDSIYTQPVPAHLKVTPSSSSVSSGTAVQFVASADQANASFSVSCWRFAPDSSATQSGCLSSSSGISYSDVMTQSGRMWAIGTVNSRTDSASAHVSVHDGSGGTCWTTCADTTTPRLIVSCGHSVQRGSAGMCTATVLPAQPFTILNSHATADGGFPRVNRSDRQSYNAGESHQWGGRFVLNTTVYFQASITVAGNVRILQDSTRFLVTPRPWTDWVAAAPSVRRDTFITRYHSFTGNPFSSCSRSPCSAMLAYTYIDIPDSTSFRVDSVTAGPDSGLAMPRDALVLPPPYIAMHPALYVNHSSYPMPTTWPESRAAASWFARQSGGSAPGTPSGTFCSASSIRSLFIPEAERHEGVTSARNSHVGVSKLGFETYHPQRVLESRVYTLEMGNVMQYRIVADSLLHASSSQVKQLQVAFDSTDYPVIYKNTCEMRR